MCKTIKQRIKFKAPPIDVYSLLTDSKKHQAFTGEKAVISKKIGGKFSIYSGHATGIIVDLVPGKRIVQAWRGHSFAPGIFSMAAFVLNRTPDGGTELTLTHRGVPKEFISGIENAWRKFYWDKMKKYLARS